MRTFQRRRALVSKLAAGALLVGCTQATPPDNGKDKPPNKLDTASLDTGPTTTPPLVENHSYTQPVIDILFIVEVPEGENALLAMVPAIVEAWIYWGYDFHAGATTIDQSPEMGRLTRSRNKKWVEPSDAQPAQLMQELISAVDNEGGLETGFDAVYQALEWTDEGEPNEGFLREDSQVAVVMLSFNNDAGSVIRPPELAEYLNALRPRDSQVEFHSITDSPDYIYVTNEVGGILWPLFAQPLNPSMQAVTEMFDPTLFPLEFLPDEDTLSVTVTNPDGQPTELESWEFLYNDTQNGIAITTDPPPAVGADVAITYQPL